ncbi:MAG: hypothetical protein H0X34_17665 [Chthoniobacterales bacterium]|nr:hypothetical protein [Chthoniobacterales bacterium]
MSTAEQTSPETLASPLCELAASTGYLDRIMAAVDSEPEMPNDMPTELRDAVRIAVQDERWDLIEDGFRSYVREAKQNIKARITAALSPDNAKLSHSGPAGGAVKHDKEIGNL